jgi:hypothetical protein
MWNLTASLPELLLAAFMFSQIGILTIWVVLGMGQLKDRLGLSACLVPIIWFAMVIVSKRTRPIFDEFWDVCTLSSSVFALTLIPVFLWLLPLRRREVKLGQPIENQALIELENRFSISHILGLMLAVAAVLGLGTVRKYAPVLSLYTAISIWGGGLSVLGLWVSAVEGSCVSRLLLAMIMAFVVGFLLLGVEPAIAGGPFAYSLASVSMTLMTAITLRILRTGGFGLFDTNASPNAISPVPQREVASVPVE